MGNMGEDLASKLRRVLRQHHVELEPASKFPSSSPPSSSESSITTQNSSDSDPNFEYISKMLMEDDEVQQTPLEQHKSYQSLLDELTTLVSPESQRYVEQHVDASDLRWTLMQCARAVAANNVSGFYGMVRDLKDVVASQQTVAERATLYFIDALVARVTGKGPQAYRAITAKCSSRLLLDAKASILPDCVVPRLFATEIIVRACVGEKRVHIVDYGISRAYQWPCLIKALSVLPGGSPHLRITGIELPSITYDEAQLEKWLVGFARSEGVHLEIKQVKSSSWELVELEHARPGEALIVNSTMRLSHLRDEFMTSNNPRKVFFERIHRMKPKVFVMSVSNAALSSPFFIPRFDEAVKHFFAKMEYSNACCYYDPQQKMYMEMLIAKGIMNIVGCEGLDRYERPDAYTAWDSRARRAGFEQMEIDEEIYERIRTTWGGYTYNENFRSGKDRNWVVLGWRDEVICGLSAWKPATQKGRTLY